MGERVEVVVHAFHRHHGLLVMIHGQGLILHTLRGHGHLRQLSYLRQQRVIGRGGLSRDRKSTRLNSSHANISYAVFCLTKTKQIKTRLASDDSIVHFAVPERVLADSKEIYITTIDSENEPEPLRLCYVPLLPLDQNF